jgi:uncharacterized protein (TIGR03083 family)
LIAELRECVDSRVTAIGTTPADRLMDVLVHGQDIAVPLGITREMPVTAARLALERVWQMGAPFHTRDKFHGCRLLATDGEWTAGEGPVVEGSVTSLLLLITGRPTAQGELIGDGMAQLAPERDQPR